MLTFFFIKRDIQHILRLACQIIQIYFMNYLFYQTASYVYLYLQVEE